MFEDNFFLVNEKWNLDIVDGYVFFFVEKEVGVWWDRFIEWGKSRVEGSFVLVVFEV